MMKFLKLMIVLLVSSAALGQQIPAPKEHFGFNIGDNYKLATYAQTEAYFQKLDLVSDRAIMQSIGKTEEGRDQFMMVVTSPANQLKLSSYKEISQKLARAEQIGRAHV